MSDDQEFYYCSKGCINWTHFWFHQQVSTKQSFINCQNSSNSLVFPKRVLFGFTYIWWYGSAPKAPLFHLPTWKAQSRKSTSFCPSTESRRTRSNNHWRLDWRISSANLKWLVLSNNKPKFQYTKQKGVFAFKMTFTTFFFFSSDFCQLFKSKRDSLHTHSSTRDANEPRCWTCLWTYSFITTDWFHLRHPARYSMRVNYCINLHPVCVFTCSVRTHSPWCGNHRQEGEIRK